MRIARMVLIFLLVLTVIHQGVFATQDDAQVGAEKDMLAMYRGYAGEWSSVVKGKETEFNGGPYEAKGQWEQKELLDGRMIEVKGSAGLEGEEYEYILLITYDQLKSAYVTWYHDSRGINSMMYGKWSEEDQEMTWVNSESEETGVTVTIVDDLSDKKKIGFTFEVVSEDGELIMQESGVAVPVE